MKTYLQYNRTQLELESELESEWGSEKPLVSLGGCSGWLMTFDKMFEKNKRKKDTRMESDGSLKI